MMDLGKKLYHVYKESLDDPRHVQPLYEEIKSTKERYVNPKLIATGGMKQIYRVHDIMTSRDVAYATLKSGSSVELYDPFIREARLTALLHHPNIIPIHDIGLDDQGDPFFTMELKEGRSLQEMVNDVDQANISDFARLSARLDVFLKICDAMAYAHSQRICHGDLKPSNIQVGQFGEVLVCDWGLGKIMGEQAEDEVENELLYDPDVLRHITLNGSIKGTPGYMSPEQFVGGDLTPASDIFSLGCMLYALLFGEPPFGGELEDCIEENKAARYCLPKHSHLMPSLTAILSTCLKKDTQERYARVEDLQKDLKNVMLYQATVAEQASVGRLLKLWLRRNQKVVNVSLFSGLLLLAVVMAFSFSLGEKKREVDFERRNSKIQNAIAQGAFSLFELDVDLQADNLEELLEKKCIDLLYYSSLEPDERGGLMKAVNALSRVIEVFPDNRKLGFHRGRAYVLMQNFEQGLHNLEGSSPKAIKNHELYLIAKKYAPLVGQGPIVEGELLAEFIYDLTQLNDKFVFFKVLNFRLSQEMSYEEKMSYIKGYLKHKNAEWDSKSLKMNRKEGVLTVDMFKLFDTGYRFWNPLKSLASYFHAFSYLSFSRIVVKGMPDYKDEKFIALPMETLDVSDSSNAPLKIRNIHAFQHVKRFVVSKKVFDALDEKKLPDDVKIVTHKNGIIFKKSSL